MMATEDDDGNDGEESGKKLREKLEAALKENATLKGENTVLKAQNLIREKGYKLITADDLKEVGSEDLAQKAEALEAEREKQGKDALRKTLEARGLSGDDLEQTVAAAFGETEGESTLSALDRIRAAGNTAGTPVSPVEDKDLFGTSRIAAALTPKKK